MRVFGGGFEGQVVNGGMRGDVGVHEDMEAHTASVSICAECAGHLTT